MLEWRPFPETTPPKSTCFFSDGCATFHVGWFTSHEGVGIYVPAGDGTNRLMAPEQLQSIAWWANPGNFIANTQSLSDADAEISP